MWLLARVIWIALLVHVSTVNSEAAVSKKVSYRDSAHTTVPKGIGSTLGPVVREAISIRRTQFPSRNHPDPRPFPCSIRAVDPERESADPSYET